VLEARSPLLFLKLLAGTAALQALMQLFVFVTGIVIVRHLTLDQYAWYTLATAMLGVATTLTDSGMRDAVMAQGGAVWREPMRLGAALAAGLAIRRKIAGATALLMAPVLVVLVLRQGGTYLQAALLCGALIPVFLATTMSPMLEVPLRIHQQLKRLLLLQVTSGVVRLVCVLAILALLPVAWAVILGALLPQLLLNARLKSAIRDVAPLDGTRDEAVARKIAAQVMRAMPHTAYYVLVSQLSVLLISIFGTTEGVAQVGALMRIALIMSFLLAVFQLVVIPLYARIPAGDTRQLRGGYLMLLGALGAVGVLAVGFTWIAPGAVLIILGPQYSSLTNEVVLAVASGALTVLSNGMIGLSAVRGVVVSPAISVPPNIALQVLLVCTLPLDAVSSMYWLSIGVSSVQVITSVLNYLWWLRARTAPDS
jgi:O-antigen/teichoic acid export membrane protein